MNSSLEWNNLTADQRLLITEYQKQVPIPVGALAKAFNITVKLATLPSNISGEIKEEGGEVTIKVNRHDVKERQRFTIAHEIAHFLLHREYLSNGISDNVLYRSSLSHELEFQANRLAAEIIMPMSIIQRIKQGYSELPSELQIERVATELEVSTTALKIRLGKI